MAKALILAALAATSLVQPAFAEPVTQTVVVQHSDLDLNTAAGAKTLQHRVWRAVVAVCGTASDIDLSGKNDDRQCRRDTRLERAVVHATFSGSFSISSGSSPRPKRAN